MSVRVIWTVTGALFSIGVMAGGSIPSLLGVLPEESSVVASSAPLTAEGDLPLDSAGDHSAPSAVDLPETSEPVNTDAGIAGPPTSEPVSPDAEIAGSPTTDCVVASGSAPVLCQPGPGGLVDVASLVQWGTVQRPSRDGVVYGPSLSVVPAPGVNPPAGTAYRFELSPGDTFTSGGNTANRVEQYSRTPSPMGSTPAAQWPDPVGSTRWYSISVFIPTDFVSATDTTWLTFTQWKGLRGGSPPVALEVKRDNFRLGGSRTNAGLIPRDGNLGSLNRGHWTTFDVGMSFATTSTAGWVEVWRDGALALPRTSVATMDIVGGLPDPVYLKQGIYRSSAWRVTHVLFIAPSFVATSREALLFTR